MIVLAADESPRVRDEPSPPRPEPPWGLLRHSRVYAAETDAPPTPPTRWPLLVGVFDFPFRRDAAGPWIRLSLWGTAASFIAAVVGSTLEGWAALAGVWLLLLAISAAVAWLGLAFASGLAILCDTAAGSDRVNEWPEPWMFLDWFSDVFFVINSLACVFAAVGGIEWLLIGNGCASEPVELAGTIAAMALFPFVLLSMLEQGSRVVPFSPLVYRSLGRHWLVWAGFYAEIAALALLTVAAIFAVLLPQSAFLALLLCPLILSAALMIYFRLLGRLAWCCSKGGD